MTMTVFRAGLFGLALCLPTFALAQEATITVTDAYARAATKNARAGAAFMELTNTSDTDARLIAAQTDVAKRVELHTHLMEDGVMKMREVEGGFVIPAGETIALARGGDHVMLMGLTQSFEQGDALDITLIFESGLELPLTMMIDNERKADHGAMKHGDHADHADHGDHKHDH